ncbi:Kae1-like domain-containing protein [Anaeromicrobium sediminis]|uniref:N(6)-L-threonylcarbamoyladenine synthase n=1 Tax=Anaeromicrobium sediminis TaxID=1478221 RepID=A0A267MN59_9FIRM|nr:O-sialoglycoprotein endopeptidase [Anaeromicrobium sediminis]PAB60966.1 hypothetical protein CCE28_00600 [Anaeromicrobium sediminis]
MSNYVLGIDTSNYTTSVAVVDLDGNIILDKRQLLKVPMGKRGLRQSDALFQHINNIPILLNEIGKLKICGKIKGVCASSKPRPTLESYMPVFKASTSFGQTISNVLGCKYFECSHQENHIKAAIHSIDEQFDKKFLAIHISGGTTELLLVKRNSKLGYNIDIIGGTTDISIGQFLDRAGVKMGFDFPAGPRLDEIAFDSKMKLKEEIKMFAKNGEISLSGPETRICKLIEEKMDNEYISLLIFEYIIKGLSSMINYATKKYNMDKVILVGGVASSNFIKTHLNSRINDSTSIYFAKASHCTDNAIGSALIGAEAIFEEE